MSDDLTHAFYTTVRTKLFNPMLTDLQVAGMEAINNATYDQPLAWRAYMLATAYHETARHMTPVREMGTPAYFAKYGRAPLMEILGNRDMNDGLTYYGRGYVQLTGYRNYARAQREMSIGLIDKPDLALDPENAAIILKHGMIEGWFSGHTLEQWLPQERAATLYDFTSARRIVNGGDRAADIALYACEFQEALQL